MNLNKLHNWKYWNIAEQIGQQFLEFLVRIGSALELITATLKATFSKPFYFKLCLDQGFVLGFRSLSIVLVTALSTGMVMSLQFGFGLERFGGKPYVPKVVGLSILRELGPVLTCLMIAGRVGSGIAAEIGSMKVTQQLDAIRALGTDPIRKVVVPRFVALLVMTPILTAIADMVGIFGGMLISSSELNIPNLYYIHEGLFALKFSDFGIGIFKSFIFGFIIAITGCYFGLNTTGGTQGVGLTTTRAVVTSSILITISDFILTKLFWLLVR